MCVELNNTKNIDPREDLRYRSARRSATPGFTLIELLIVVAIIGIIASVIFVALNPLKRFQDSRDAKRFEDARNILDAIKLDQVDNGGSYLSGIGDMVQNKVYMIGTDTGGCNVWNSWCETNVEDASYCINLGPLTTEGYLGSIPISPNATGTWTGGHTGYTLTVSSTIATVRACEKEGPAEVEVSR
jgi:prepilin-type N-terminal cleavage/methylation domain-containing protein